MIEECNFKVRPGGLCALMTTGQPGVVLLCRGEDNCVLYNTYKLLTLFLKDYTDRLTEMNKMLKEKGLLKE